MDVPEIRVFDDNSYVSNRMIFVCRESNQNLIFFIQMRFFFLEVTDNTLFATAQPLYLLVMNNLYCILFIVLKSLNLI